jgi:hypothetical protein
MPPLIIMSDLKGNVKPMAPRLAKHRKLYLSVLASTRINHEAAWRRYGKSQPVHELARVGEGSVPGAVR